MRLKVLLGIFGAISGVVLPGAFGVRAILERRRKGGLFIASTLHLNARWWTDQGTKPGELLYVAIGDSAAQGVGASLPGRSYVGLVARHLREKTGQTVRVANLSVSGARIRNALDVQLPQLAALDADIVTVAIGANDIAAFEPARFERELDEMFAALPTNTIVADVPTFYLGSAERNVRLANVIVNRLALRHGLEVAPVYRRTSSQGVARYAFNQVAADFFHPNDRGYRVWASAFLPVIDRLPLLHRPLDRAVPGA